jgi:hypothetical protein
MIPTVSFDGNNYTISLFRPDATGAIKEEKLTFGEHSLEVCAAPPNELHMWDRAKINGPPAEDGLLYYLCAQPQDVGAPSFVWLKNKEDAAALRKAILDAEDKQWRDEMVEDEKNPCSFCGEILRECGGDHGDEMRDIQREALRGDRY